VARPEERRAWREYTSTLTTPRPSFLRACQPAATERRSLETHSQVALEILVNDDFLERTLEAIVNVARTGPTGSIGDGKIFVLPAEEVIRVSDGIRGKEAV
jgi:nitrogen regulatory protein PII